MPFDRPCAYLDDDGDGSAVVFDPGDAFAAIRRADGTWVRGGVTIGFLEEEMTEVKDAKVIASLIAEARAALDRPTGKVLYPTLSAWENAIERRQEEALAEAATLTALDRAPARVIPLRCKVGPSYAAQLGFPCGFQIMRGEHTFWLIRDLTDEAAAAYNATFATGPAELDAMICGCIYGWHVPGANPATSRRRRRETQ